MPDDTVKEKKKGQIIIAAAAVFAQNGYNGATIAQVAAQAGVGKGTVYEYFDSKLDLGMAVHQWMFSLFGDSVQVDAGALSGPVADRLRLLVQAMTSVIDHIADLYAVFMEYWAATASTPFRERIEALYRESHKEHRDLVGGLIREGIGRGEFRADLDVEAVSAGLVAALDGLCFLAWFDKSLDAQKLCRNYLDGLIGGLMVGG